MSDITIDAIKGIVGKTLDQFQEAVLLLKSIHDGTASQQEIAEFLRSVGIVSDEEQADAKHGDDALLVGHALSLLNADTPISGVYERHWMSPARTFLAACISNLPMEFFREIVNEERMNFWLVQQTLKEWGYWANSTSITPRRFEAHLARNDLMEIVPALLRELRK